MSRTVKTIIIIAVATLALAGYITNVNNFLKGLSQPTAQAIAVSEKRQPEIDIQEDGSYCIKYGNKTITCDQTSVTPAYWEAFNNTRISKTGEATNTPYVTYYEFENGDKCYFVYNELDRCIN